VHNLTSRGVTALSADYIPTRKNVLVEHFLPDNGFTRMDDGTYYCELDGKQVIIDKNFPINIEGPV
jgi:predicted enzyme involved in methoxymalonyl-ACP biosynthesis